MNRIKLLVLCLILATTCCLQSRAQQSQIPGGPFECDGLAYLFQGDPAKMIRLDPETSEYEIVSEDLFPGDTLQRINAVGFNSTDHYFWGYRLGTNELVRISSDFSTMSYTIAAIPDTMLFYSGDIDENGIMYLLPHNEPTIWRVDLNPFSENYLTVLDVLPTDTTIVSDWAVNPADNQLYALSSEYHLYRFDTSTGSRTDLGEVTGEGLHDFGHYGTAFFDSSGKFYFSHNQNGNMFSISATDLGNTSAEWVGLVPFSSSNDGAMCSLEIVGQDELPGSAISIFPNPCESEFVLKTPFAGLNEVLVYDTYGRLIVSSSFSNSTKVLTSDWSDGLYVVRILHHGEIVFTERIVKQ
ncbi:MAG: T9SS type A sorting domain-containing protein [Flavobacteriales bacterium]